MIGIPPILRRGGPSCVGASLIGIVAVVSTSATAADVKEGERIYRRECAVCHGASGLGDGPAAVFCDPKPRNFEKGLFKIRSTQGGELPTDEDLIRTVTRGMPGTGMPSFRHLGDEAIRDVVAFLKTLGGPEDEDGSWFELYVVPPPVEVPPPPPVTDETIAEAKKLYDLMGCDKCHGETGHGDGKDPEDLLDSWDNPIHVRDFHLGVYKGGHRPEDLYLRIMTGLDGTPMSGFWKEAMTPEQRWALVHYLVSMGPPREVEQPSRGSIVVPAGVSPSGVADPAWDDVPASEVLRMPLKGGWLQVFEPLEVEAARMADDLVLRVTWSDGRSSCPPAVQAIFPAKGDVPTFAVGSKEQPLEVWRWHSEEGAAVLESKGPGRVRRLEASLTAEATQDNGGRTVSFRGRAPEADWVLFRINGCVADEAYETSSTFYELQRR